MSWNRKTTGHYYRSLEQYENLTGDRQFNKDAHASIHISGSVRGMRKLFWGYECDVVRIGQYVYKIG